jgi:hypothetical protein
MICWTALRIGDAGFVAVEALGFESDADFDQVSHATGDGFALNSGLERHSGQLKC